VSAPSWAIDNCVTLPQLFDPLKYADVGKSKLPSRVLLLSSFLLMGKLRLKEVEQLS
jgi:hypothetical protein